MVWYGEHCGEVNCVAVKMHVGFVAHFFHLYLLFVCVCNFSMLIRLLETLSTSGRDGIPTRVECSTCRRVFPIMTSYHLCWYLRQVVVCCFSLPKLAITLRTFMHHFMSADGQKNSFWYFVCWCTGCGKKVVPKSFSLFSQNLKF